LRRWIGQLEEGVGEVGEEHYGTMDQVGTGVGRVGEHTMAEEALRDFDLVEEALADKDVAGARKVLLRLRRRASQMSSVQRQQAEALIKLAQLKIKGFNQEASRTAARRAKAKQERQLLTAKCVGCGRSGSQTSLTKKSGSARCATCQHTWAHPICTKCGEPFKRQVSMPRQRVCPPCGGGNAPTPRTVSGGLPTLGRRG